MAGPGCNRKRRPSGAPLQVVPHITDAIQDWIERVAHTAVDGRDGLPDVCIIELGGTVRGGRARLLACVLLVMHVPWPV